MFARFTSPAVCRSGFLIDLPFSSGTRGLAAADESAGARVRLHFVLFTVFLPSPGRRPPRGYRPGGHALAMADLLVVAGIVVFVVAMLALIRGLERI